MADLTVEQEKGGLRWPRYCAMTPAEREAEHRLEQIRDTFRIAVAKSNRRTLKERRAIKERTTN